MRAISAIGLLVLSGFAPLDVLPATASPHDFNFLPGVGYSTGSTPHHVALGDLDEDGRLDIVTANRGAAAVTVRFNNGTGGFSRFAEFPTDNGPRWSALADFNEDGHLDLVTANNVTPTLTVRLGDGRGGFGSFLSCGTTYPATSVAVADFNRDGHLDLAATAAGTEGVLEYFPGLGTGAFGSRRDLTVGKLPYAVVAADFNGDSKMDVAIADHGQARVWVVLGSGTSAPFSNPVAYVTPSAPWCVAVGDLDNDRDLDIASANDASPTSTILINTGSGSFTIGAHLQVGSYPYSVAIGDVNRDGNADLVTTSDGHGLTLSAGNGDGTFTLAGSLSSPGAPVSVALGDLSGHGVLDLAVVSVNTYTLSVFLQATGTEPTTTALTVEPAASTYGEPVILTARVSPDSAQGYVEFLAGDGILGLVMSNSGVAQITTSELLHGVHRFRAGYKGSGVHAPSQSDEVMHPVALAKSKIGIALSANPVLESRPFWAVATVSAPLVHISQPQGSVEFCVDGVPMGPPVHLYEGVATSPTSTDLESESHLLTASYLPADTLRFAGTADSVKFVVEPGFPAIAGVKDVPHDQGGKVFLTWRCRLDTLGTRLITGFRVWRRVPDPTATTAPHAEATWPRVVDRLGEAYWEPLANIPSAGLGAYGFTSATTQDSLAESNAYSVFFVQALTADPSFWFVSEPDSGYSVDNLSPRVPAAFSAEYGTPSVALHWSASSESDFREYRLYRGPTEAFEPDTAHLLMLGPDTGYVDVAPGPAAYKLVAVDVHGNTSRVATVTPRQTSAVLASFVEAQASANRIELRWSAIGNPGLSAAVYRRTLESAWELLGHRTADVGGVLSYADETVIAGVRYAYRIGIEDGDRESFAGATWITAEDVVAPYVTLRENPVVGGAIRVRFAVPALTRVRLELLDIAGRRVAQQDFTAATAGPASVELPGSEALPAGVYLLRCSGGPIRGTQRVVKLR